MKATYRREQFKPSLIGLLVNPFYFARKGLFENISALSQHVSGKTLDVGCGQKPYADLFSATEYVGLELDTPENRKSKRADFYYDGRRFPFADRSFDSVVCNQVLEHVFQPEGFLSEISRVLKIDGTVLLTVPFVWDEHEQPWDFARYSSFGIHDLLMRNGFDVIEQRKSVSDIRVIFQLINAYIYKVTLTRSKYANLLTTLIVMAPFNFAGQILGCFLPENVDLYLDNVVVARKRLNV